MTQECIASIFEKTSDVEFEIILVDNASTDGSKEHFEKEESEGKIHYIYSCKNLGFGRANNLGAKYAKGKYLFLLNSDTILNSNVISDFLIFLENNSQYVCCGANLLNIKGENTVCHGAFPSIAQEFSDIGFYIFYKEFYKRYLAVGMKVTDGNTKNVDYLSGADIFILKRVFNEVGGFDERFFMYYEETDMFNRLNKLHYQSCLLPNVSIVHLEGGSFNLCNKVNINRFKMQFTSKVLYYKLHKNNTELNVMKIANILSIISRFRYYKGSIKEVINIIISTK